MNTRSAIHAMPQVLRHHLAEFGADIRKARKRRKLSQAVMADRCLTTPVTIRKVENGDPTVSFGIVASMLWALGLESRLGDLLKADPFAERQHDSGLRASEL